MAITKTSRNVPGDARVGLSTCAVRMAGRRPVKGRCLMSGTYNDGIAERSSHADRAAVAGLTTLAGILLLLSGLWSLFDGLAGIINNKFYVVTPNYAFKIDATAWDGST
jgi:hypothetical protein